MASRHAIGYSNPCKPSQTHTVARNWATIRICWQKQHPTIKSAASALFSNDWYPTLKQENVELIHGPAPSVTKNALFDADGVARQADVIIWGTGFKPLDFVAPMKIYGLENRELSDVWNGTPEAYLGTTVSGFPNMFIMYGPNTNHGAGSVPYSNECQYKYILDAIKKLQDGGYGYLDLKSETLSKWRSEMQERSAETV